MKKKAVPVIAMVLSILLLLTLAGCGSKDPEPTPTPAAPQKTPAAPQSTPEAPATLKITIQNDSGYIFNALYISPTDMSEWGSDHLGSTNILKDGGSFDVTLDSTDNEEYDIRVVDEEADEYIFTQVTLGSGATVTISFSDGLCAVVQNGSEENIVYGDLISSEPGGEDYESLYFDFTIYNESDYDIYAIYLMPAYADGEGVDILPQILSAGESYDVYEEVSHDYASVDEWNIEIIDVDGDESAYYEVFNPWELSYIDVYWDDSAGGYVCEYVY